MLKAKAQVISEQKGYKILFNKLYRYGIFNGHSYVCFCVPLRRGGGHIAFVADPVGVSVSVGVGMTLPCLHDIS